ncbi:ArsR family transcriptional regulator [Salipiger sp. P9]|uniref:ArsR/SmtB family transcription factor n=1 Tax=Salipiger pentaromativorans TaxID=2943193 RepID=UPI002158794C|nr:metalloregulator ArsR/SmtB family transcription factor [Salipiger pentaromativorans]MCR8548913.1 ArsR family transcriptional regulator [Salipiger pentaromativorans]
MIEVFGSSSMMSNPYCHLANQRYDRTMDRSTQIKAMASAPRLKVLKLLAEPEKHFADQWSADPADFGVCMTLIAEALGVSQPTVSRHLDILRQAGFITVQRHLKWSYCRRDETAIAEYLDWLARELSANRAAG